MIKLNQKLISFILATLLVFTFSACKNGNAELTASTSSAIVSSNTESTEAAEITKPETSSKSKEDDKSSSLNTSVSQKPTSSKSSSSPKNTTTTSKSSSSESIKNTSTITPKLYKVTDANGNVAWLFGSIHVGKESFFPLPDYVMKAFEGSDVLAVEFDLVAFEKNFSAQTAAMATMISPNGSTKSHLTGKDANLIYNKARKIFTDNNINYLDDYYMPILWSNLIDSITYEKIGAKTGYGIDRHLINKAKQKKIKIENIESAEAQYKMLAGFSNELQTFMLKSSIDSYENANSKKQLDTLMNVWEKGDYTKLRKMLNDEYNAMQAVDSELCKEYNDAMSVTRDSLMTDYVINALSSGKEAFVCVGAAHIARNGGIVDLLKAKGYKIEEVK